MAPQENLVVYNTPALFNTQFPFLLNKVGPFFFGLDGDGDAIRLYNASDKIIFSVYYDDDAPWVNEPDGFGYTLEADTNFLFNRDVCNGSNWFTGCPEGSPGVKYNPDCSIGINEISNPNILIYPNPTSEIINIEGVENLTNFTLKLYSSTGQLVKLITNQLQLNVSNLTNGIYILQIETLNSTTRKKILVSHE